MKSPNAIFDQRKKEKSYSGQWPKLLSTSAALKRCSYYKLGNRIDGIVPDLSCPEKVQLLQARRPCGLLPHHLSCPEKVQLLQALNNRVADEVIPQLP